MSTGGAKRGYGIEGSQEPVGTQTVAFIRLLSTLLQPRRAPGLPGTPAGSKEGFGPGLDTQSVSGQDVTEMTHSQEEREKFFCKGFMSAFQRAV